MLSQPPLNTSSEAVQQIPTRSSNEPILKETCMALDKAGNTMARATAMPLKSTFTTVSDRVGGTDPFDVYRINAQTRSRLNVAVEGMDRGVMLQMIHDRNRNRQIDAGEVVQQLTSRNSVRQTFQMNVQAGIYFLRLRSLGSTPTFRLQARAQTLEPTSTLSPLLEQVLQLTNQYRQQNGLQALTYNSNLATAAQSHTQNMALQDFFSHTGLDGSNMATRVSATGYTWTRVSENIAAGQRTASEVVTGWMNSAGHRANILDPNVREIGLGHYYLSNDTGSQNWNYYWTQVFARGN